MSQNSLETTYSGREHARPRYIPLTQTLLHITSALVSHFLLLLKALPHCEKIYFAASRGEGLFRHCHYNRGACVLGLET